MPPSSLHSTCQSKLTIHQLLRCLHTPSRPAFSETDSQEKEPCSSLSPWEPEGHYSRTAWVGSFMCEVLLFFPFTHRKSVQGSPDRETD